MPVPDQQRRTDAAEKFFRPHDSGGNRQTLLRGGDAMSLILRYLAVLAVLAAGDALWLSWFGPMVFRPAIGSILLDNPRWSAIVLFYLFYAAGVVVFPVALGDEHGAWLVAALY